MKGRNWLYEETSATARKHGVDGYGRILEADKVRGDGLEDEPGKKEDMNGRKCVRDGYDIDGRDDGTIVCRRDEEGVIGWQREERVRGRRIVEG